MAACLYANAAQGNLSDGQAVLETGHSRAVAPSTIKVGVTSASLYGHRMVLQAFGQARVFLSGDRRSKEVVRKVKKSAKAVGKRKF